MEISGSTTLLVNSAFYDDRANGGSFPSLRLLTISDVNKTRQCYCHVWYPGVEKAHVTKASRFTIRYKRQNPENIDRYLPSQEFFVEYVMSCKLPTNQSIPSHVSVVAEECVASDILVPVTVPLKPKQTIDFGVCVAGSYGKLDTAVMVEWFELNKILGVKEFNIYNVSLSESMNDILQYYTSTGDLILHHMSPMIPKDDDWTAYMNSLPTLNHCFFTNMYRYEHVLVIDFDEVIIPKAGKNVTYTVLVQEIKEKYNVQKNWTTLTFYNEYFFYEHPPDMNQPSYLPALRHRLRNTTSPLHSHPKSMSNPQNCLFVGNHQCVRAFPNTTSYTFVEPEIATNHHYRLCNFPPNRTCSPFDLTQTVADDAILAYKVKLDQNVIPVLKKLQYFNSRDYGRPEIKEAS